jgi:hypothetical protein
MLADSELDYLIGVDAHRDEHVLAVVAAPAGAVVARQAVAADGAGYRQLNCALHRIAVTQGRVYAPARAYLERKQSEGKSRREALRCLKRQLARTVYTTLTSESALT